MTSREHGNYDVTSARHAGQVIVSGLSGAETESVEWARRHLETWEPPHTRDFVLDELPTRYPPCCCEQRVVWASPLRDRVS